VIQTDISDRDLERLESVADELHRAGRNDEAETLLRAYLLLEELVYASDLIPPDEDNDPEFNDAMEAAERDIQTGRLIPHDEVERRLWALDDG
jgi:hypothetical protein